MSERPTRHELAYLRACSAIDGIQHACKKPEGFDFDDVVTRLLDAYEATQRPVEPSAHRSEPVCAVCKRAWNADPGTVYCGSHHGTCGMCSGPRATCTCLTSEVMQPVPHRSEQAAPPADPLEGRRPWLEVGHNGDEPEAPQVEHECGDDCMPARNLHFRTAAPPANDVGARVTHEEALYVLQGMVGTMDCGDMTIARYIRQQAELERRARELDASVDKLRALIAPDGLWYREPSAAEVERVIFDVDALAELLGTEES